MKPTGYGQSTLLLLDVIKILNTLDIPYAIIGAFAASFYGVVRASMDADVIISLNNSEDNLDKLLSGLKKSGLKITHRKGDPEDPIASVVNVKDHFNNQVDLLTGIRGMHEDIFSRINNSLFMEEHIRIIGIEDFIAMKIFAGSPKDINDAIGALKVSPGKINFSLLRNFTQNYGKNYLTKLETLLKESL